MSKWYLMKQANKVIAYGETLNFFIWLVKRFENAEGLYLQDCPPDYPGAVAFIRPFGIDRRVYVLYEVTK